MGVDCNIYLPGNVRVQDVAKVVAVLAGRKVVLETMIGGGLSAMVEGWRVEPTSIPEMARIAVSGPLSDAAQKARSDAGGCYCYFHFECDGADGRLLSPRSTPFWIAVGRGLVNFFGGAVDYNDCDDGNANYKRLPRNANYKRLPRANSENCPTGGTAWETLQKRIAAVKPLAPEHFDAVNKFAAYPIKAISK
jgi:hypothetical protein